MKRERKNICHANLNPRIPRMAILILDKVGFREKNATRSKGSQFSKIVGSMHQADIMVFNIYDHFMLQTVTPPPLPPWIHLVRFHRAHSSSLLL